MLRWFVIFLLVFLLGGVITFFLSQAWGGGGSESVSSQVVVQEVRRIGRLELVHYRLKDVLEYRVDRSFSIPGTPLRIPRNGKVLLVVSGEAIGCIDLTRLDSDAVTVTDSVATIRLPRPELCVVKVDHQHSKVYDADFSVFTFGDKERAELMTGAFRHAENNLRKAALDQGILAQTEAQAQAILPPLLRQFGIKRVVWVK